MLRKKRVDGFGCVFHFFQKFLKGNAILKEKMKGLDLRQIRYSFHFFHFFIYLFNKIKVYIEKKIYINI